MKEVISISLGSSSRNHTGIMELGSQKIKVTREGTDGDTKKMVQRYEELDGKVDAFGAGGFLFGFHVGERYYKLYSSDKLVKNIKQTPIVDGSGIKDTIERNSLQMVWDEVSQFFENKPKTALITSTVDRYGMFMSIYDKEFDWKAGDFMFALGVPIAIKNIKTIHRLARVLMPVFGRLPIKYLYPTGEKQDKRTPKFEKMFNEATLIAGDFLYTKKYSPDDLTGKIILTNTTTKSDMDDLFARGVECVITSTPNVSGRTFGTNVLEAAVTAYADSKRPLTIEEIKPIIDELKLKPQVHINK